MRRTTRTTAAAFVTLALIAAGSPGTLHGHSWDEIPNTGSPENTDTDDGPLTEQRCWNAWTASRAAQECENANVTVQSVHLGWCRVSAKCPTNKSYGPSSINAIKTGTLEEFETLVNCGGFLKEQYCSQ